MDFERLQKHIEKLETYSKTIADSSTKPADDFEKDAALRESAKQAMKNYAATLKQLLMDYLKETKAPVRPGQLYRDCAAKSFVPGELGGDNLLIKWAGNVTPSGGHDVHESAGRFAAVSEKLLPVLKAYRKE